VRLHPLSRLPDPWRRIVDWLVTIGVAVAFVLAFEAELAKPYRIPSSSMEHTLHCARPVAGCLGSTSDRVLVNKLAYHAHPIHRGDIVVFTRPKLESGAPTIKDLIKRVIATPGDTIESSGGHLLINGRVLVEPYLPPGTITSGVDRQVIPSGEYWVMGDNRSNSRDSRFFQAIPKSLVVGRAFVRVWPLSSLDFL